MVAAAYAQPPANPAAGALSREAEAVFAAARPRLLQIRLILGTSQAQASIGSGFIASRDGWVITNYHVVANAIAEPANYSIEFVRADGTRGALELAAVDVVNDLAVLRLGAAAESSFELRAPDKPLAKGERVFAMGNPHDLGLTIVEGTFNGRAETSFIDRFHYTGAINPGMSGGPAVDRDGRVVGINVARMVSSQLVSFLVPAERAIGLLARARAASGAPPTREEVGRQLGAHQAALMTLLDRPVPTSRFDRYEVPDSFGAFMRCWGRSNRDRDRDSLYTLDVKQCSVDADVFVSGELRTGDLQFRHVVLASESLGRARFQRLFAQRFSDDPHSGGSKREFTPYRCDEDFIDKGAKRVVRVVVCARAYKQFSGLADVRMKVATLESDTRGLISTLELNGVEFARGMRFARAYLEALAWAK